MFRRFRSLFSSIKSPAVSPSGATNNNVQQKESADEKFFVIAATDSEGIGATTLTQDQLLAQIRHALGRDRENQKTGYSLFVYSEDGQRRLPFFTSNEHAQVFCGEYSKQRNRVFPFMILETNASFLTKVTSSRCDVVVMNDKNPDEHILSESELDAAGRLACRV